MTSERADIEAQYKGIDKDNVKIKFIQRMKIKIN